MKRNDLARRCLPALLLGAALIGPAAASAAPDPAVPPASSEPLDPVVAGIDWSHEAFDVACGAVQRVELADGRFEPDEYNGVADVLTVELAGVGQLPTRDGYVLVHLSCVAGGPGAALSQEIFLVVDIEAPDPNGGSAPDASAQTAPMIAAVLIAEPGAAHIVNDDGVVVVDDVVHGANDPQCCPSVLRSQQIVWDDAELPVVVAGARPDALPDAGATGSRDCVATELTAADSGDDVRTLEAALVGAGFDPGPVDGLFDDSTVNAVVRFIEFNAGNPMLHDDDPDRPYDTLHAEASRHRTVRRAVLTALGIACDDVARLPAS